MVWSVVWSVPKHKALEGAYRFRTIYIVTSVLIATFEICEPVKQRLRRQKLRVHQKLPKVSAREDISPDFPQEVSYVTRKRELPGAMAGEKRSLRRGFWVPFFVCSRLLAGFGGYLCPSDRCGCNRLAYSVFYLVYLVLEELPS